MNIRIFHGKSDFSRKFGFSMNIRIFLEKSDLFTKILIFHEHQDFSQKIRFVHENMLFLGSKTGPTHPIQSHPIRKIQPNPPDRYLSGGKPDLPWGTTAAASGVTPPSSILMIAVAKGW